MRNFDEPEKINHNSDWPYITHHPYRIFIVVQSRSRKINALLNLTNHQVDINKIYSYIKDPNE